MSETPYAQRHPHAAGTRYIKADDVPEFAKFAQRTFDACRSAAELTMTYGECVCVVYRAYAETKDSASMTVLTEALVGLSTAFLRRENQFFRARRSR